MRLRRRARILRSSWGVAFLVIAVGVFSVSYLPAPFQGVPVVVGFMVVLITALAHARSVGELRRRGQDVTEETAPVFPSYDGPLPWAWLARLDGVFRENLWIRITVLLAGTAAIALIPVVFALLLDAAARR